MRSQHQTKGKQNAVLRNGIVFLSGLLFTLSLMSPMQAKSLGRNTQRLKSMPDFTQTHAGLPQKGLNYCGPSAASNALIWLSLQGHQGLGSDQLKMVNVLGSAAYLDVDPQLGVGNSQMLYGLKKYVEDHGSQVEQLYYHGWRSAPKQFRRGVDFIRLPALYQGLQKQGVVLINLGWYQKQGNDYLRTGGHWVTLAGYLGQDLIVFDPAPRNGKTKRAHQVRLKVLKQGQFLGPYKGLPRPARGHYAIHSGLNIGKADLGVLDGAVFLQIKS